MQIRLPKWRASAPSAAPAGPNPYKNWLILGVAILMGLGGAYLVNAFINARVTDFEAKLKGQHQAIGVVVPQQDLAADTIITSDLVAVRNVPDLYVHSDAVRPEKFELAEGQRLRYALEKGKPLLWAHLAGGDAPTFSMRLPNGKRAITVPVDEINSISGMLQPKDKIDLILTISSNNQDRVTFPLMQDVLVLATGTRLAVERDTTTGEQTTKSYNTVTLEVTQDNAQRIILAQDAGKLTALLRNPEDTKLLPNEKISVATLLGQSAPARAGGGSGIEIILGGVTR